MGSSPVFAEVRVAYRFSFVCCVLCVVFCVLCFVVHIIEHRKCNQELSIQRHLQHRAHKDTGRRQATHKKQHTKHNTQNTKHNTQKTTHKT
jgi:preprotein translocase subunit SecG